MKFREKLDMLIVEFNAPQIVIIKQTSGDQLGITPVNLKAHLNPMIINITFEDKLHNIIDGRI